MNASTEMELINIQWIRIFLEVMVDSLERMPLISFLNSLEHRFVDTEADGGRESSQG